MVRQSSWALDAGAPISVKLATFHGKITFIALKCSPDFRCSCDPNPSWDCLENQQEPLVFQAKNRWKTTLSFRRSCRTNIQKSAQTEPEPREIRHGSITSPWRSRGSPRMPRRSQFFGGRSGMKAAFPRASGPLGAVELGNIWEIFGKFLRITRSSAGILQKFKVNS